MGHTEGKNAHVYKYLSSYYIIWVVWVDHFLVSIFLCLITISFHLVWKFILSDSQLTAVWVCVFPIRVSDVA